jgi:ribosomal-protein-alanine N-acetyltransferase
MSRSRSHTPSCAEPSPGAQDSCQSTLVVSAARLRDLSAVAGVQRRAFPPALAYTLGTLALLWVLPWVRLLVARRDGEIVGCVIGDRVLDGGRVINLAVDPIARRQGVGTALMHAIERALPGGDMTLMVHADNDAAQALYRSVGYMAESTAANYYGPGRPGVRMRKTRVTGW